MIQLSAGRVCAEPLWRRRHQAHIHVMEPAVKILLIEDSPVDSRLLQLLLAESAACQFEITHVERLAEGLARLGEERFDAVLSDLTLPDSHGYETFQKLRRQIPDTPIVLLSGVD